MKEEIVEARYNQSKQNTQLRFNISHQYWLNNFSESSKVSSLSVIQPKGANYNYMNNQQKSNKNEQNYYISSQEISFERGNQKIKVVQDYNRNNYYKSNRSSERNSISSSIEDNNRNSRKSSINQSPQSTINYISYEMNNGKQNKRDQNEQKQTLNERNLNYDNDGYKLGRKQKNNNNKGQNEYDYNPDNAYSYDPSSAQSSKLELFERNNDYDVSDGQSDDSLNISDLGDEKDINVKRYQSKQRFEKREQVQEWEIEYSIKKFRANMKKIMTKKQLNLRTIFRQLDVDNDNYITYIDFCRGLSQMNKENQIYFDLNDFDLITCLFERLDVEKQKKISFNAFRQVIYKSGENFSEIQNLLRKVRLRFNQKDKQALEEHFKKFDKDNDGKIQFLEFKEALSKFDLQAKEIDALFIYFDKLKQNEIGYVEFSKVLFEDYMVQSNIAKTIQDYMDSNSMTLRQLFGSFCDPETKVLTIQYYIKMMKKIGFKYQDSIIEETFDFFDADKNGSISFEEFENTIYEENITQNENMQSKVPTILRTIRRQSISRGIDICLKFQNINQKTQSKINFNIFSECLRDCSVDIKQYEKEVVFSHYKKQENDVFIDIDRVIDDILNQKFDIAFIKERLLATLKRFNLTYGQLFSFFDSNKSETINFQEFSELLDVIQVRLTKEEMSEAFATFDINQDGDVTQDEFIRVLEGKEINHQIRFESMLNNLKLQEKGKEPKNLLQLLENKGIKVEEAQIKDIIKGKIQENLNQEIYLRFVKEKPGALKEEFDFDEIMNVIIYNIQDLNIDFFHEFVRIDVEHHCVLLQYTDFQSVLQNINIFFTINIIQELYLLFLNPDKQFEYIKFLMHIYNPFYLFKKVFIYQMQIKESDLNDMILTIKYLGKDKEDNISYEEQFQISPADFVDYCHQTYLTFEKSAFQYIWFRLNPLQKEKISIEEFALGLRIPYNYDPFIDLQNFENHQLEVINQFCHQLAKSAYERNINIIEVFLYFDKECTFKLIESCFLQKISNILQIRMSHLEIKAIYTYLSKEDPSGQMPYFELIKKSQLPQNYLKSIFWIFLRMENWTLKEFFNHFKKENTWDLETVKEVIGYSKLRRLSKDIEKSFKIWTKGNEQMTLSDLSRILNIKEDSNAKDIEIAYLNLQNANIKDLLHLIDTFPQANANHYLYYYINDPTDEYLQNQRKILKQGEDYAIKERIKESKGGYLTIEEQQNIAKASQFLSLTTSKVFGKSGNLSSKVKKSGTFLFSPAKQSPGVNSPANKESSFNLNSPSIKK